jgi:DNA polymerase III epsilon subunit family exonuclease
VQKPKFKRRRGKFFSIPPAEVITNPARPDWLNQSPRDLDIVFLDFETTGGNPLNSTLIEIGAIRYSNGAEVDRFETLVNPNRHVPHIVQKITGISNDILVDAPKVEEVFKPLIDFIGDSIVVAHGAQGDVAYLIHLSKELLQEEFKNFYFCTHLLVHHYLPHVPSKTLSGIAEYFALDSSNAHTAMSDAEMTAGIFWKFYGICEKNGLRSCEDLFKLQGDFETIKKLGPGINPVAVDNVTTAPGVLYLLNSHSEISYLTAASNIRKELRKLTEMGTHRDMNQIIADAANFKFSRTHNYLGSLIYEKKELQRISLKIDPRKFYHRSENFIQILIPEDLHQYYNNGGQEYLDQDEIEQNELNENEFDFLAAHEDNLLPAVPLQKSRKPNAFVKTTKYQQNRQQDVPNCLSVGNLKEGLGYYFGPFESVKQVVEQVAAILELFPFEHTGFSVGERLLHLRILISFLNHDVENVIEELKYSGKGLSSLWSFSKQMKNKQLVQKINRVLEQKSNSFITNESPKSGLAIISVNETKEFQVYVISKGKIVHKFELPIEQSDKFSNPRFITRLFEKNIDEIKAIYEPMLFTENSCSDIELFCHWLNHKKGEGEFVEFKELENLYDISLL